MAKKGRVSVDFDLIIDVYIVSDLHEDTEHALYKRESRNERTLMRARKLALIVPEVEESDEEESGGAYGT